MRFWKDGKRIIALLLSLLLLLSLGMAAFAEEENAGEEPTGETDAEALPQEEEEPGEWETQLLDLLQEYDADPATITAGYYNFATGEEHYYNADEYRVSGSMYKVPLNMLLLDMVAEGELQMDDLIGGFRYSELLKGTIIDSNNDYARILWDYVGATIQTTPASTYYHRYRILIAPLMGEDPETVDDKFYENNFFTARQMLTCMKALYDGGEKYEPLIEAMQEAEPNKYFKLHENRFNIAHKYGWFAEGDILYMNDCALCFTDDPIAIVLFTTGTQNAYGVMTAFCTLMCEYTQEQHRERTEREEAEAAAAVEEEKESPGEEPPAAADPSAASENGAGGKPASAEMNQEPELAEHRLELGPIVALSLIAGCSLVALVFLALRKKNGLALRFAVPAVLLAAAAMLLCFPATNGRSLVTESEQNPQDTIREFFLAIKSGNYDAANACLVSGSDLGLQTEPGTEVEKAAMLALQESWNYSLFGDAVVRKTNAWQQVQIQTLDFSRMEYDLQKQTRFELLAMAKTMPLESLYDEDGNTRREAAEEAYDRAMLSLLENAEEYYATEGIELELRLTEDGWKIVPGTALLNALSGILR